MSNIAAEHVKSEVYLRYFTIKKRSLAQALRRTHRPSRPHLIWLFPEFWVKTSCSQAAPLTTSQLHPTHIWHRIPTVNLQIYPNSLIIGFLSSHINKQKQPHNGNHVARRGQTMSTIIGCLCELNLCLSTQHGHGNDVISDGTRNRFQKLACRRASELFHSLTFAARNHEWKYYALLLTICLLRGQDKSDKTSHISNTYCCFIQLFGLWICMHHFQELGS